MANIQGNHANGTHLGTSADDEIYGFAGHDFLYGDDGNDLLFGGYGDDTLDGGTGADTMDGGDGNDTYYVDDVDDVVVEEYAGHGDTDIVYVSVTYFDLKTATVEQTYYTGYASATILGSDSHNYIASSLGADHLEGKGGDDWLFGGAGDDYLDGGEGDDELDGWQGNDVMVGGHGDDTYHVDTTGDVLTEYSNEGTDTVRVKLPYYTLLANFENADLRFYSGSIYVSGNSEDNLFIMGVGEQAVVGGAGSDTVSYAHTGAVSVDLWTWDFGGEAADDYLQGIENLVGSAYDDVLRTLGTASIIDGGPGADIMEGRYGSDIYYVDNSGDVVIEGAGGGTDEVRVRNLATYTLPAYVEKLSNVTDYMFTGIGNDLDNEINGGHATDYLYGGLGHDTLNGGAGDDQLYGGDGHDVMHGGSDADAMYGGEGNDIYYVECEGDTIIEYVGEGTDHVFTFLSTFVLSDHVENLTYHGADDPVLEFTGSNVANLLVGKLNNDIFYGMGGADELWGNAGDDFLDGGSGDDLLIGGEGSDTLTGGTGGDLFRFFDGDSGTGAGADRIVDFNNWIDKIDLRDVDSDGTTAGNQAFCWIGGSAFSGTAGELRFFFDGTDTWLQGDQTGDGVADFEIVFTGSIDLYPTDFYL